MNVTSGGGAGYHPDPPPDSEATEHPDRVSLPGIATREDCERLVRLFYTRALADPIIGFLFTDIAKLDLEAHIPRITRFWETVLLGAHSYGGGAFGKHLHLHAKVPLLHGHFERWLYLWGMTVDELFSGPVAEQAKVHAGRVATAFQARLRAFDEADDGSPAAVAAMPVVHQYGRAGGG
ncbi:MAG: group III truncated hemoglobin [Solirubrobacteraceae bacterium]